MSETTTAAALTATPNLNKALSQLQGELPRVTKSSEGKIEGQSRESGRSYSYSYKYADLADVTAVVGPLLAKHGLAFHCAPTRDPADRREMILAWSLLHVSGEEKTGEWPLGPANQKPQSLGSAITYGRRYCLGAATGIVAEDDDDGQRAQRDHGSYRSAGEAFQNATPAPSRNSAAHQQEEMPPPPPRLEPGDAWAQKIDDIKTPEEADAAEAELKQAYEAGETGKDRTTQILHWIRVKAAPMRTAARSPRPTPKPVSHQPADSEWQADFVTRLYSTPLDGLTKMRGEIGRAVADRKISPEDGNALSAEVVKRRKELEQGAAAEGAEAA